MEWGEEELYMPGLFPMDNRGEEGVGETLHSMCEGQHPASEHEMLPLQSTLPKLEGLEIPLDYFMPKEKLHPTKPHGH